jgi:PAS domain-containing protein
MSQDNVVEAMRSGAHDVIDASQLDRLGDSVERALGQSARSGASEGNGVHNVDAQQRAEAAHKDSEQKLRSIVEQSTDGIFLTDETGIVLEWNGALERISGIARSEALGKPLWDLQFAIVPGDRKTRALFERLKTGVAHFLATAQIPWPNQVHEMTIERADGQGHRCRFLPFDQTDKGYMMGGIARGMTGYKMVEEALSRRTQEIDLLYQAGKQLGRIDLDIYETVFDHLRSMDCDGSSSRRTAR